ncbi:MAG TPA: type II toxin-antitoxin system death-on-curing family toxin [Thermoanaerobaculia bacterium]|nr:type II toxin-antitoxin system death-on-curing family toxin [Thermoanaerobaculia bacterium]
MSLRFLTLAQVLELHELQLGLFGGSSGTRDLGLLESALGNVQATFGGEYLHQSIYEMGAAYLYGICRNHPFIDGNKRTAAAAALTFLDYNRIEIEATEDELYDLVIGVAEGRVTKDDVALFFERHTINV